MANQQIDNIEDINEAINPITPPIDGQEGLEILGHNRNQPVILSRFSRSFFKIYSHLISLYLSIKNLGQNKLDKGNYTKTAQDLKNDIDRNKLSNIYTNPSQINEAFSENTSLIDLAQNMPNESILYMNTSVSNSQDYPENKEGTLFLYKKNSYRIVAEWTSKVNGKKYTKVNGSTNQGNGLNGEWIKNIDENDITDIPISDSNKIFSAKGAFELEKLIKKNNWNTVYKNFNEIANKTQANTISSILADMPDNSILMCATVINFSNSYVYPENMAGFLTIKKNNAYRCEIEWSAESNGNRYFMTQSNNVASNIWVKYTNFNDKTDVVENNTNIFFTAKGAFDLKAYLITNYTTLMNNIRDNLTNLINGKLNHGGYSGSGLDLYNLVKDISYRYFYSDLAQLNASQTTHLSTILSSMPDKSLLITPTSINIPNSYPYPEDAVGTLMVIKFNKYRVIIKWISSVSGNEYFMTSSENAVSNNWIKLINQNDKPILSIGGVGVSGLHRSSTDPVNYIFGWVDDKSRTTRIWDENTFDRDGTLQRITTLEKRKIVLLATNAETYQLNFNEYDYYIICGVWQRLWQTTIGNTLVFRGQKEAGFTATASENAQCGMNFSVIGEEMTPILTQRYILGETKSFNIYGVKI